MRRYAAWLLQLSASTVATGLERARQVVRQTDRLLADGRPFLASERFSAADLALACMLAPFVLPTNTGHGCRRMPSFLPPCVPPCRHSVRLSPARMF